MNGFGNGNPKSYAIMRLMCLTDMQLTTVVCVLWWTQSKGEHSRMMNTVCITMNTVEDFV